MKRFSCSWALSVLVLMTPVAHAAKAEPMDVDIDIQQQLVKDKTKQRQGNIKDGVSGNSGSSGGGSSSCGNVDIGNSAPGKGSGQFAKPTTVIITGPVINANNNCK